MVHVYPGASAGIVGALQGMQEGPDLACAFLCWNTSHLEVSFQNTQRGTGQLEDSHHEPRAGGPSALLDVEYFGGGLDAEYRNLAVGRVSGDDSVWRRIQRVHQGN